jgi:hypothetical protein
VLRNAAKATREPPGHHPSLRVKRLGDFADALVLGALVSGLEKGGHTDPLRDWVIYDTSPEVPQRFRDRPHILTFIEGNGIDAVWWFLYVTIRDIAHKSSAKYMVISRSLMEVVFSRRTLFETVG